MRTLSSNPAGPGGAGRSGLGAVGGTEIALNMRHQGSGTTRTASAEEEYPRILVHHCLSLR
ncbi:hypothetical protein D9M72_648890 [compost metagenome]